MADAFPKLITSFKKPEPLFININTANSTPQTNTGMDTLGALSYAGQKVDEAYGLPGRFVTNNNPAVPKGFSEQVGQATTALTGSKLAGGIVGFGAGFAEPLGLPKKASQTAKAIPKVFKGFSDLSTKLLEKLKGRTTVSRQFIEDLSNSPDLKQPERDLIRRMLPNEKEISVPDFAKKVKSELLPLKVIDRETSGGGGTRNIGRYENIVLPDELRGSVETYGERVYQSPVKTGAGDVHFGYLNDDVDSYFAHTRIEDLPDNQTRRAIEIQSDLFQKGRLEGEAPYGDYPDPVDQARIKPRQEEVARLEPYRNTWHERVIREEVKQAAKDGKTKLQFPTGETAMKIEGLVNRSDKWVTLDNVEVNGTNIKNGDLITYQTHEGGVHPDRRFLITKNNGDGTFKAVDSLTAENDHGFYQLMEKKGMLDDGHLPTLEELQNAGALDKEATTYLDKLSEQLSAKDTVDTNNPIYKFYNKEVRKYLTNKYGAKEITDPQGVKWIEVDIKPEFKKLPIEAFGVGAVGTDAYLNEDNKKRDRLFTPTSLFITK